MRRYSICFLIAAIAMLSGFAVGMGIAGRHMRLVHSVPDTVYETETCPEIQVVIRQEEPDATEAAEAAAPVSRFYLVSETGYLLVFTEGKKDECMQTHIPITDFPQEEQEKLREGIWFDSMMEVFFYLESYTS